MTGDLRFNGILIRDHGDMLCLTDMWKAAGGSSARAPSEWLRSAQGTQFVAFVANNLNMGDSHVIDTKQGKGGGTWAHWQIGMAYAQYLSPEFHAWCNSVVRAHMEGKLVPTTLPQVSQVG